MSKLFAKENFTSNTLPKLLVFLSALALLTYTALRAYLISMTHDECGSFKIWLDFNIFSCFVDDNCWRSANLHFLYVLLMKGTVGMFGDSELAIRLPSLVGHIFYLYFSWRLVKMWSPNSWIAWCGFVILNANPLLLEFFSLARGYGLAMTCMMTSLYYLGSFIKNKNIGAAWWMFIAAFLGVFSNFTQLNFYACMVAVLVLIFIFQKVNKVKTDLRAWRNALVAGIVVSVFMAVVLYMPITALGKYGEYQYGASAFWDTIKSCIKRSLFQAKYFHMYNVEVFAALLFVPLTAGGVYALRISVKRPEGAKAQFTVMALLLPVLASLASIIQHHLMGVNYLVDRTALLFIPLVALGVFMVISLLAESVKKRWVKVLPFLVAIFILIHAVRTYNLWYASEWWYDAHTREMLAYLDEKIPEGKTVKLGLHWLFHPSSDFYRTQKGYDFCEPLIYEKNLRTDDYYDYYYIQPGEENIVDTVYQMEKRFGWVGILMVKKSD